MSVTRGNAPLGGFEQRLLTQLRARVATQPALEPMPANQHRPQPNAQLSVLRRLRIPRLSLPMAAALTALVTGVLSILPAASPALARAFPIVGERTQLLPARLARVLGEQKQQWGDGMRPAFDLRRAYAFRTAAGTGYVIVDERNSWLCILVPGFSAGTAGGRCERLTLARLDAPALALRISAGHRRQEIVALLPRGTAALMTTAGRVQRLSIRGGVLTITTRGPVTVTTALSGHRGSSVTFTP